MVFCQSRASVCRCGDPATRVRYADDFAIVCELQGDAEKLMGCAAEAIRKVRAEAASGEDSTGALIRVRMSATAHRRRMIVVSQTGTIDNTSMPVIHTARLDLHPVQKRDVELLHNMWVDAAIRRYLWDDIVIDRSVAERVIEAGVELWQREKYGVWVIYENASKRAIGFVGFRPAGEPNVPEILFGLLPSVWGNGYATEAARAALGYMRTRGGVAAIHAETDEPNVASIRVLERLGMRRTGVRTGENAAIVTFRCVCDELNVDAV